MSVRDVRAYLKISEKMKSAPALHYEESMSLARVTVEELEEGRGDFHTVQYDPKSASHWREVLKL